MEATIYFILLAAVFFVMMRYGCGAHVMGHGHSHGSTGTSAGSKDLQWIPPAADLDPVCGKTVDTAGAKSSVHAGRVYYFCSQNCRERFETAPDTYLKKVPGRVQEMEQPHA